MLCGTHLNAGFSIRYWLQSNQVVKESLDLLSKSWKIDAEVYDLHLGKRQDVVETRVVVDNVVFHIPLLEKDCLYVLWKCIWPDCHNCCDRQGRLPLTKDDIKLIARKMGYTLESEFIRNEVGISSWSEMASVNNVITTITMLSLKRRSDEKQDQDGKPLRCRFLDDLGYCGLHPEKPGVCWLYPFASWMEAVRGKFVIHATFQLTGDCPGFYTSKSLDPMMPILRQYSKRIYDYNMAVNRTSRENYCSINLAAVPEDG